MIKFLYSLKKIYKIYKYINKFNIIVNKHSWVKFLNNIKNLYFLNKYVKGLKFKTYYFYNIKFRYFFINYNVNFFHVKRKMKYLKFIKKR